MLTNKQKRKPISKRLKLIGIISGVLIGLFICFVVTHLVISKIQSSREHTKLLNELSSLNLSSSKPIIIGFENEPTNSELLLSDTYPGVHISLTIDQTTLGAEINSIKATLLNQHFKIQYDHKNTPTDIIGTSKNYFINIGLEYNGSEPPRVNTGQKSSSNGGPIFAEPGADTKVNGLQINLEDTSRLNSAL